MMGELKFFLGLQVRQQTDRIFISQGKYIVDLLKKFGFTDCSPAKTPMSTANHLTASRPDIIFATSMCARYQANPKESHLHAVKRIYRYLKNTPHLGLWYPRDSPFELIGYTDSDHAGCAIDRKSTSGGCQLLGNRLISCDSVRD